VEPAADLSVAPFKGLFSGPSSEGRAVTVEVTRLA
jgi:hypothetical protein